MTLRLLSASTISLSIIAATAMANNMPQLTQFQQQLNQLSQQVRQLQKSPPSTNSWLVEDTNNAKAFEQFHDETFELQLLQMHSRHPKQSLVVGGRAEIDAQYWSADHINIGQQHITDGSKIFIHKAYFDLAANPNQWTTVFLSIKASSDNIAAFNKAFINVGDLNKTPFFMSIGKDYLPWGLFSDAGLVTHSLTREAFRPAETTQLTTGYYHHGLTLTASWLNDQYQTGSNYIMNGSYQHQFNQVTALIGAGYINDLRGSSSKLGQLAAIQNGKAFGAWDLNAECVYRIFGINGEYIASTRDNPIDDQGIASSWYASAAISPTVLDKPTKFTIGYSRTNNMQDVPLPLGGQGGSADAFDGIRYNIIADMQRPIVRNIAIGLEYVFASTYRNRSSNTLTFDVNAYY